MRGIIWEHHGGDLRAAEADLAQAGQVFKGKQHEILQAMAPKYEKVLNDLIQIDQIDLILSPNQLQYANPKHDISRRVTEKLNEASD